MWTLITFYGQVCKQRKCYKLTLSQFFLKFLNRLLQSYTVFERSYPDLSYGGFAQFRKFLQLR